MQWGADASDLDLTRLRPDGELFAVVADDCWGEPDCADVGEEAAIRKLLVRPSRLRTRERRATPEAAEEAPVFATRAAAAVGLMFVMLRAAVNC